MGQKKDGWLPGAGRGEKTDYKGAFFLGDGNVLYLDCGGGYLTVCVCHNKKVEFYSYVNYTL